MHRLCLRAHIEIFFLLFLREGAHIQHSDCARCVDDIKIS